LISHQLNIHKKHLPDIGAVLKGFTQDQYNSIMNLRQQSKTQVSSAFHSANTVLTQDYVAVFTSNFHANLISVTRYVADDWYN
jgi:hypothetical protein